MRDTLLRHVRTELRLDSSSAPDLLLRQTLSDLRSRLSIGHLAIVSVAAATLAAGLPAEAIDPARVAASYRSDRLLTVGGVAPTVWSPFSGFWRAADGWIRTHGNYPHHADALRRALHLGDDAGASGMSAALASLTADHAVHAIESQHGLAVAVRRERPATDRNLRARPLLEFTLDGTHRLLSPVELRASDGRPLQGIRVLDLTRVIAGPICTRTLALLGADVLRIDPPGVPEPEWQHLDTGHGKRSAILDARSDPMDSLLSQADAVVLGYRPAALARLGLAPDTLARRYPHLVIGQLSAWGTDHPERAGFDSLVQAESGIAWVESADGITPGALPAQALDHSAGYLLAAALTTLLRRSRRERAGWQVSTSLRRIAAELLGMPRNGSPENALPPLDSEHTARFDVAGQELVTVRPAIPGLEFSSPRPWGTDQPVW